MLNILTVLACEKESHKLLSSAASRQREEVYFTLDDEERGGSNAMVHGHGTMSYVLMLLRKLFAQKPLKP